MKYNIEKINEIGKMLAEAWLLQSEEKGVTKRVKA
jgi:hypothetical protein